MTTMTMTHAAPAITGSLGLAGMFARIAEARRLNAAFRQTRRELSWLTDRELADLGLMRCDIDRIAREAVYGA